ncbi:MAG: amidohydrolase family protein [Neomegalonema sp.]|nr:amidohydrolase family protein [Neomegalonema sp.]
MTPPPNTRPLSGPAPKLTPPPGAVDTHIHIYLEGFEAQPGGPAIPELATVEDYRQLQKRLGLERVVVTQSNAYQFDNGSTLAALDQLGPNVARGVVAVSEDMTVADLEAMHARGVRGARIMNLPGGATPIARLKPVEKLARAVGWHLMVQFDGRELDDHLPMLQSIEVPFIIDHIAKFLEPVPADDRRVDEILRLLDRGDVWFKICAGYETSKLGGPHYEDVAPVAKRVIAHAPERIIWGSNWPHVGVPRAAYPDDAELLDILLEWASEAQIQRILVDNPATLYGFDR